MADIDNGQCDDNERKLIMGQNYLVCYESNNIKKWDMIPKEDKNEFLLELMQEPGINLHSIFIIPTNMCAGIWLWINTHKTSRVDFWNFFSEYGQKYEKVKITHETKELIQKIESEKAEQKEKYGFISPNGEFFTCAYRGHYDLASKICFGMINTTNPEQYLEENGWCKVYKPAIGMHDYAVYVGDKHVLTEEQLKTLIKNNLDKAENLSAMLVKNAEY